MTDQQIRDRIVGALSVSMVPIDVEAECINFLDRCLRDKSWHSIDQLPPMTCKVLDDFGEPVIYEESDPVQGYTRDRKQVVVTASVSDGRLYWTDDNGTTYSVTHWRELPEDPREES